MSQSSEFEIKLDRVAAFLEENGLDAVLLGTQRNFAWLTCGGSNHVGTSTPDGVAYLLVLRSGQRFVITPNNETRRIVEEETSRFGFESISIPWFELRSDPMRLRKVISEFADPEKVAADIAAGGFPNIDGIFSQLRYSLTPAEVTRYREHGISVAAAIEKAARHVRPGMSEREIEADLTFNLLAGGARPTVLLVAADRRFQQYRHPIPTENRVERYVALSTCARRAGLTVAVTRLVHFGPVPEEIVRKYRALQNVEARLLSVTRPGALSGEILNQLETAYADNGFADEWREHHQGGATGYLEREWVALPGGRQRVEVSQAFAWNPTIAGTKIEDTILTSESGIEILTASREWPMNDIQVDDTSFRRPDILIL